MLRKSRNVISKGNKPIVVCVGAKNVIKLQKLAYFVFEYQGRITEIISV